jgi:hypothetical protein
MPNDIKWSLGPPTMLIAVDLGHFRKDRFCRATPPLGTHTHFLMSPALLTIYLDYYLLKLRYLRLKSKSKIL